MTDPLPDQEAASGYNTNPRPRPRKRWFRFLAAPKDLEGFYTPFWPLLIVFMSFVVLLIYEISFLRSRALSLRMQNSHLIEGLQKANGQVLFIQGLHGDLAALAPTHPVAGLILREFFPPEVEAPAGPGDAFKAPVPADSSGATPAGAGSAPPPATAPPHP